MKNDLRNQVVFLCKLSKIISLFLKNEIATKKSLHKQTPLIKGRYHMLPVKI